MSHDSHNCGHSDEEHMEMLAETVASGDLSPLFAAMPVDMLVMNVKSMFNELFVRCENDEEFSRIMERLNHLIQNVLVNGDEESEIREGLLEARSDYQTMLDSREFVAEAEDELRIMLEQHGVLDDTPTAAVQDEQYGFYL